MKTKSGSAEHVARMKELVGRWRDSGKSQADFCREHEIKTHTLSYWVNRKKKGRSGKEGLKFVELSASAQRESVGSGLKYDVVLPSGITIKVGDDVDVAVVGQLAGVLGGR